MRTLLLYIVFTLLPFSVGALLNAETSDAFILIVLGILLGITLWFLYFIWHKRKKSYSRFEVYCSTSNKLDLKDHVMPYFVLVMVSVIVVSLINAISLAKNIQIRDGVVVDYTTQRIRHTEFDLLKVRMSDDENIYIHYGENKVPIGARLRVKINNGVLGFPRVQEHSIILENGTLYKL